MSGDLEVILTELRRLERRIQAALDARGDRSVFAFSGGHAADAGSATTDIRELGLRGAAVRDMRDIELRERHIPVEACDGPAWNMLLFLLVARIEGRSTSVTDACSASRAAPTTALRHLEGLVKLQLCRRAPDPGDRRRSWIALSDRGYRQMAGYYAARHDAVEKPPRRSARGASHHGPPD